MATQSRAADAPARLGKSELIEQLLESQNAYAVARAARLQASAPAACKKVEQKITNRQSI